MEDPVIPELIDLLGEKRGVFDSILIQNTYDKNLLKEFTKGNITKKEFKDRSSERLRGQWQWGTCSHNIRQADVACKHQCVYCYVTPMFERLGKECKPLAIEDLMPTDIKKVNKRWKHVSDPRREMVFFPSSSDIFYENAIDYVKACMGIFNGGHEIFFVSKPTIKMMCAVVLQMEKIDLRLFREKVVFFVTITSDDNRILKEYEPNASTYEERVDVIKFLKTHNMNVNVMIEPYLSDPVKLATELLPILPPKGIIAIGQMNYMTGIVLTAKQSTYLKDLYSTKNVKKLWKYANTEDRVFLKKDSINAVVKAFA